MYRCLYIYIHIFYLYTYLRMYVHTRIHTYTHTKICVIPTHFSFIYNINKCDWYARTIALTGGTRICFRRYGRGRAIFLFWGHPPHSSYMMAMAVVMVVAVMMVMAATSWTVAAGDGCIFHSSHSPQSFLERCLTPLRHTSSEIFQYSVCEL